MEKEILKGLWTLQPFLSQLGHKEEKGWNVFRISFCYIKIICEDQAFLHKYSIYFWSKQCSQLSMHSTTFFFFFNRDW